MTDLLTTATLVLDFLAELPLTPPLAYELARMTLSFTEVTR